MWMSFRSFRDSFRFHEKWTMGCLEAFQGNTNGAKQPHNLTYHVGFPRNVSGENMTRPGKIKKVSKTAKIEGYNTRFRNFPGPSSERHGMPPRGWEVIGKLSCGLERICGCVFFHFETVLGFTRNEQMGCLESFRGNINGAKHPRNVAYHVGFPRNVSRENMTRPEKIKICLKNSQNWRV